MINPDYINELMIKTEKPTTADLFRVVTNWLDKHSELYARMMCGTKDGNTVLDYCEPYTWGESDLGEDYGACEAIVNTGGSEGIYIDWYIKSWSNEKKSYIYKPVGTLKTLDEDIQAYRDMGALAGEITCVCDCTTW